MYTLQECFEVFGKKFPFTVTWYHVDLDEKITPKIRIFTDYHTIDGDIVGFKTTITDNGKNFKTWHSPNSRNYDYREYLYKKEFEEMINK